MRVVTRASETEKVGHSLGYECISGYCQVLRCMGLLQVIPKGCEWPTTCRSQKNIAPPLSHAPYKSTDDAQYLVIGVS